MPELTTNRDLYLAIGDLVESRKGSSRSLQEYLRALLGLTERYRDKTGLEPSLFFELLSQSFDAPPIAVEPSWFRQAEPNPIVGYDHWQRTLVRQIVDLVEMEQSGALADEHRYFGIDAPRGGRWFNFDPCTYIECGAAGAIGGWEEGDATGRILVPGPVAVLDCKGEITSADPRDLHEPLVEISLLAWEDLTDFLRAGQYYE